MSTSALLRQLGFLLILAAAAAAAVPYLFPRVELSPDIAGKLLVAGGVLAVLGLLLGSVGVGRRACQRCGHPAARGSVFCASHQRELMQVTREAVARSRRR